MNAPHRRRVPRRGFNSPVGLLVRGAYRVGHGFQVGEGGMSISSPIKLSIGHQLVVNFYVNQTMMIVRGVVRSEVTTNQDAGDLRYGIEFSGLEFSFKREIRNFVAS